MKILIILLLLICNITSAQSDSASLINVIKEPSKYINQNVCWNGRKTESMPIRDDYGNYYQAMNWSPVNENNESNL